jgi:predicted ATPase/DNA-binding winged helix-turn-helix (wHTH) protein
MMMSASSERPARISSPHGGASHTAVDLRELEQTTPPVDIKSSPSIDNRLLQDVILFGCFRLSLAERLLEHSGRPVKLSGRALDVLIALIGRAGEIVDKRDLMALVWPDVTVDENSLRFHVAALRKALGDGQAGARYLVTFPGRGYCFVAPVSRANISRREATEAPVRERSGKLPAQLTRMIGRAASIQEISKQLNADRFVTIVGPGGIGKTTVAVSLAHLLAEEFEDGVYFFDLGALSDSRLVPGAVASTLGIMVRSDDPTPSLIAFLQQKRMLLVFDSCEHVIATVATLAECIFQEASQVYVLATSRETLRVEGEHIHQLTPLESPPDEPDLTFAQILGFPAAQLFIERVAASGCSLELTDTDAAIVGEICRRLDGIALAIELAAGRVTAHGMRETATLLNHRFRLLWDGRRTAPLRHQTLSATLDWSYHLLSERERIVFRRFATFVGIFTLEGARAVASCDDIDENEIVAVVASLVSKSLLAVDSSDATARFRLLDTTRAYAIEKLAGCGEADQMAQRHATYYLQVLERANAISATPVEAKGPFAAAMHLGNIRSALEWAFSERGDNAVATALAAASIGLFLEMSLLTECRRWTEQAIVTQDDSIKGSRREVELQSALGLSLMFTRGNTEQVRGALARGLEVAEELGDLHNQLQLLGRLHIFHERIGDYRSALMFAKRGEVVAADLADPVGLAEAHSALGISYHLEGNNVGAHSHLKAASTKLPLSKRINTFHFGFDYRNRARIALARTLWLEGYPDKAVTVANETIQEADTTNHPVTLCIALIWAVSVFVWIGDLDNAETHIERFRTLADRHSLGPYQAGARGVQGELSIKRGNAETGILLLRSSLETLHSLRYELLTTTLSSALAEGLEITGEFQSSLQVIDETIASVERNGDSFYMPELLRIKGSILAPSNAGRVEEYFIRSLEMAGRQSALAWELRTATSLAKFWAGQDRRSEARAMLASVHGRFTEGFETADYRAAGHLLMELGHPGMPRETVCRLPGIDVFRNGKVPRSGPTAEPLAVTEDNHQRSQLIQTESAAVGRLART